MTLSKRPRSPGCKPAGRCACSKSALRNSSLLLPFCIHLCQSLSISPQFVDKHPYADIVATICLCFLNDSSGYLISISLTGQFRITKTSSFLHAKSFCQYASVFIFLPSSGKPTRIQRLSSYMQILRINFLCVYSCVN